MSSIIRNRLHQFKQELLKNKDMRCKQCENYIVTNEHAERLKRRMKLVKNS